MVKIEECFSQWPPYTNIAYVLTSHPIPADEILTILKNKLGKAWFNHVLHTAPEAIFRE